MASQEERLALYIDFENVAIGARDNGLVFEMGPLHDALAERGRLVVRKAYADWNLFRDHRRDLVDGHVELIEIPQRSDSVRKNAADIQMAVDALELAFTREFVSTFVVVSGDSDFTPLVSKLRELNKRVIGVGMQGSTSKMLPAACDEFLFFDKLDGVSPSKAKSSKGRGKSNKRASTKKHSHDKGSKSTSSQDLEEMRRILTKTLSGLQSSTSGVVLASNLKRALLRKNPTFSEGDHGFRGFREFLTHFEKQGLISLNEGSAPGDPEVDFASTGTGSESDAFELLKKTVKELMTELGGDPPLSGLKDQMRKREENFSEKDFGYSSFLQFCKAAVRKKVVEMDWEEEDEEYYLYVD